MTTIRARIQAALIAAIASLSLLVATPAQASTYTSFLTGCTTSDSNGATLYHWLRVYGYQGTGWFSVRSAAIRTHPSGPAYLRDITYYGRQTTTGGTLLSTYGPIERAWASGSDADQYYEYDLVDGTADQTISQKFTVDLVFATDKSCTASITILS